MQNHIYMANEMPEIKSSINYTTLYSLSVVGLNPEQKLLSSVLIDCKRQSFI